MTTCRLILIYTFILRCPLNGIVIRNHYSMFMWCWASQFSFIYLFMVFSSNKYFFICGFSSFVVFLHIIFYWNVQPRLIENICIFFIVASGREWIFLRQTYFFHVASGREWIFLRQTYMMHNF